MKISAWLRKNSWLFVFSCLLVIAIPPGMAQINQSGLQLVQQAHTLSQARRFQEAIPLLQQAATSFEAQGDRLNQAMALSNLAATSAQLGDWEQADRALSSSLSLLRSQTQNNLETRRILAKTKDIQGQIQLERGQFQEAIDTWNQTLKLYQQLDAKNSIIQTKINQSLAWEGLGMYPKACKNLLATFNLEAQECEISPESLQKLKIQEVSLENVRVFNALGHVLRVLGKGLESQQVLLIGLEKANQLGVSQEKAALYLNQGNTARALANQPALKTEQRLQLEKSALEFYNQAAELGSSSENSAVSLLQIQARLNQLSLLTDRKNWTEAELVWRQFIKPEIDRFPSNKDGVYAQINLTQSLLKLAQFSQTSPPYSAIEQILNRATEQAQKIGDPRIQAYIFGAWGRLLEIQQKSSQAENYTTKGLSLAPSFKSPDIAYQLLWQLGRIYKKDGNTEKAIAQYTQAVNVLTSLRSDLVTVNPEVQFSFRESVEPVYRELVGLLLEEKSPSQTKLKQARQTIESLQLAELDNFFRDACADAKPKFIDEIDPTSAVIYPIVLSDRLEVIVSIPGKPLRHYTTQKSQAELEKTLKRVRNSLRQTASLNERLPLAQQLYDWLIRPAESDLASSGIKTLVFVLDGYLRNLPMAIMHDGQQYIIQKYSIALTPGLQLLEPRPLTQVPLKVLTGALTEARQGFPALPAVNNEIKEISAEIPNKILVNGQFLFSALQNQIKNLSSPIVHLATHGQFSSNAADTFILTWEGRVNVKEFDRLLRSRGNDKQSAIELLVLSACETASGDDRAALGLAGVAIRSGARSTLGTLWQVNDESTSIAIAEFYRELAVSKVSKAEALRKAQLKVLQNEEYQNPYFWAPFVLVGNWQ